MKKTLVVGVTGRRYIVPDAVAAVEQASDAVYRALESASAEEIIVCTGLSIGADRIAAYSVLREKARNPESKLKLRAVLPMPLADYDDDFSDEERLELRAILSDADEVVELPRVLDDDGNTLRMRQYEALRDYLVEKSDALVAYWSGDASIVKKGGTVDVVLAKTHEFMRGRSGLVVSVATPELLRIKNADGSKTFVPEKLETPGRSSLSFFGDVENLLNAEGTLEFIRNFL